MRGKLCHLALLVAQSGPGAVEPARVHLPAFLLSFQVGRRDLRLDGGNIILQSGNSRPAGLP